ncbi:PREDICTED: kelch-like protein 38 [Galeopterus variegatus]|uniref:Kelch-like protein 38 n=1 Tax=Galeopterus variegatus TaxID=482537 RepID=A0ABM0RFX7_GALVR|nr:PREDICTED: kelch-like protein 38 [Galeopterus variegatus]
MDEESPDELLFKDQDFSSDLLRQLNGLRQNRMLTDVSICAGTWEVPCHRNVLASSSPYFKAMFCSNFRENSEAKVQLKGIDSPTLDQIVLYVYTGEVHITAESVLPLMGAASMLQYPKLFEACSSYLQSQLAPSNCLGMIRLSEILSCETLKKKAREVALTCFPEVAASADLKELCAVELQDYLGDDGLCGEEEKVFEALMVWIKHDLQARKQYVQDLFQQVRLQYIHPAFFHHFIANDSLLQSSPTCRTILETAKRHMFSLHSTSTPDCKPPWHVPPRNSYQDCLILLGGRKDNQQTTRDVLLYNGQTGQWRSLAKLPARLYKASAVTLHRSVYVFGGMAVNAGKSLVSHNVYIFSLKLNQWRLGEPMLAARYSHRSTAQKNFIFSIGGIGEGQELMGSLERYDSICNVWESMASMPVGVLHPAVAVKDQRLYLFGGEDIMQNPVRLIQVYHISRNTWFKMETRMIKNVCAPAVVLGERIIIVGGEFEQSVAGLDANLAPPTEKGSLTDRWRPTRSENDEQYFPEYMKNSRRENDIDFLPENPAGDQLTACSLQMIRIPSTPQVLHLPGSSQGLVLRTPFETHQPPLKTSKDGLYVVSFGVCGGAAGQVKDIYFVFAKEVQQHQSLHHGLSGKESSSNMVEVISKIGQKRFCGFRFSLLEHSLVSLLEPSCCAARKPKQPHGEADMERS